MSEPENNYKDAFALIRQDMELEAVEEELTEQEVLDLLADRVAYMLEHRAEFLFSLLYRLDVEEAKVEAALHPGAPVPGNVAIANLILERQKQRIHTKRTYKQPDIEGWDEF